MQVVRCAMPPHRGRMFTGPGTAYQGRMVSPWISAKMNFSIVLSPHWHPRKRCPYLLREN